MGKLIRVGSIISYFKIKLVALLDLIVFQTKTPVYIYINSPSVIIFLTGSCWTLSVGKIFIGNFWFVGEFAVNKFTDGLQMENAHKKKLPA